MRILRYFMVIFAVAGAFLGGLVYERAHSKPQPQERRILHYVDPMHPAYTSDKPGIAPDCGMKLVPVYADEAPGAKATAPGADLPMGTINISSEKQQMIGVRYGFPEMTASAGSIRAVGKVAFDETRLTRVHSKVEGWIEKVHVDFTGALVKAGQPLLTIYSPEMLASRARVFAGLEGSRHHEPEHRAGGEHQQHFARRSFAPAPGTMGPECRADQRSRGNRQANPLGHSLLSRSRIHHRAQCLSQSEDHA